MHKDINVNVSGPVQPTSTYKTVVLKGNLPFNLQVTEPNTKYVIKHNIDLGGESVTIPENCILEFDGGSISNGTLVVNKTVLIYNLPLNEILTATLEGTWTDYKVDVDERIENLEEAIGEGGSVDDRIATAKAEIIGNATSACNTLGEAEALISTETTARQSAISNVIGDAASEYNTLGKLEDKIQAEVTRAEAAEGTLDGRVNTLEEAVGTGGSVDSRISSAVSAEASRAQAAEALKANATDVYTKAETYNKIELNNMITTPEIAYKDYDTYADMVAETNHPAGAIYRVANYDGTQAVTNKYAEYSWDGTQYRLMAVRDHGVDDEPTTRSENLVKSGGVKKQIQSLDEQIHGVDYSLTDISGFELHYGVIGSSDGKWKNVNSSYQHIVIPVDYVGSKLSIKVSNSSPNVLYYAYLKSYNNPQSGDSADYCSGTTLKTINIGSSKTKESVPNDCNYIILETVFNEQTILIETFKLEYSEEGELPAVRASIQAVNNKIDHITPEFYGAIADGTTDCTQAIQDCLDNNHTCHLGVGTYLITDTIIIPEESVIKGEGRNTIIKYGGTEDENTYMFKTLSTSFKPQISDLCLNGNELCSGIYDGENSEMASATRLVVQNVMINDCIIGITLNSNGSEFSNIYIKGSQLVSKIGFNILKGDNIISDCRAFQHSEYGFKINSGSNNIVNCKAALNDVGFYISGNNSNILAYSQENFGDNIVLQNARRNIITFISDHAGSFYVNREPTEEETYINYGKPKDGMGLGSILKISAPCINNIITINSSIHGQILSTASFETSVLDLGEASTIIGNTITIGYGVLNSEFTPFDFEPIKGVSFNYGNSIIVNGTLPFNANSDILKVNNYIDITKQAISSVNSVFGNELEYDEQKSIISGTLSNPSATNIIDFALVYNNLKPYGDVVFVVNNVDKESDVKLAPSLFRINTSAVEPEKEVSIGYKNILDYFDMHNSALLNINRCILKSSSANLSSSVNIEIKVFAKDKKMFEIENEESEIKTVTGSVYLKKNYTYKVTCSPSDVNGGTITFRNINSEIIHTMSISGGQEKALTMSDDIYEVRCYISGNTAINIM